MILTEANIPHGWYLLSADDILVDGDKWHNKSHGLENEWRSDGFETGHTVYFYGPNYYWIRAKPSKEPTQPKEWLNPWD